MSIHFLTLLDQSLSPWLSSVVSWLRNKNIQCFEGGGHLVYGRIDLPDPESRHQAKVDFLFACEPGQIAQAQLEEHELLDPAFKKYVVTLMTSELCNVLNNLSAKDIEILLWRALHQIPKNPAEIDFLHRSSTVTCNNNSTHWHLNPQSYAYICQNPNIQKTHTFPPNRHEHRFLMAISQDTPQNFKTAVEQVNYYIEHPFSQNNQPVHIDEHYHRFNELNWEFKNLVDPLVAWL